MKLLALSGTDPITKSDLDSVNPLTITNSPYKEQLSTPGGIISRALEFIFPLAGLVLFVMIVWGGFEMLSTASTKKSMDAGRQRITYAIIGYILLFASYWIIRILEMMFGVNIVTF